MHQGDVRTGTMPVSGLQYSTSPSLPTAIKAMSYGRDTNFAQTLPSANATTGGASLDPLPQSTLDLYDRHYLSLPGTQPASRGKKNDSRSSNSRREGGTDQTSWSASLTLPDGLSSIGPSARRLLQLDAVQRNDAARGKVRLASENDRDERGGTHFNDGIDGWGSYTAHRVAPAPVVEAAARTLPVYSKKTKVAAASSSSSSRYGYGAKTVGFPAARRGLPAAETPLNTVGTSSQPGRTKNTKAARFSYAQADVRPLPLSSAIATSGPQANSSSSCAAAAHTSEAVAPPLVTQLQAYIRRELIRSTASGATALSAMEQLGPYREAFRALCSAFPAYASLMSDIQSVYDNVIQAQAELLTDAYATMTVCDVERNTNQEVVSTLHGQVDNLQTGLKAMEEALASRVMEEEERQQSARERPRSSQLTEAIELRRELDSAHQRIGELEQSSQSDLEKIVILIGAVRECDRRLKEYERIVAGVTGQVSELDEFKRIAGDAQAELMLFRKKYSDYVPVTDFQLMKEYLAAELEAARLQTRRWRRTAAVRGTQLDVMQRRLATLEEQRVRLMSAVEADAEEEDDKATQSRASRALLTPRPSWSKLHSELPELAEYAADVGLLTTADDRADDVAPAAASAETAAPLRKSAVPTVKGPRETALQVEYLVHRVKALEEQLRAHQQRHPEQQQQQQPQRQLGARQVAKQVAEGSVSSPRTEPALGSSPLVAPESTEGKEKDGASAKRTTSAAKGDAGMGQRRTSRRTQQHYSDGVQASLNTTHSGGGGGAVVPSLAAPLELPLIGIGYGSDVPVYLRASGVVPRRPVTPSTIVSLVYHFFLDVLPPYMDAQDQLQCREEDAMKRGGKQIDDCLYEFLKSEMATREDLRGYASVSHLMMNLMRDGEGREWFADALHVLLWTVKGVLPPRVAVDAAVVVAQVKRDVRSLAKELQSSRLRRQALSECLQPVLELKSPSELAELRAALGNETTFSVDTLCSDAHPFMEVLLVQECRSSADLYVSFLCALSTRATAMASRVNSATARGSGLRTMTEHTTVSQPQLEEGDRVVSLADIAAAIQEVEPQTPEIVVRELSVNAATASGKQDAFKAPATPVAQASTPGADGRSKHAPSTEEACVVVRLSDIVRAIGAAPLIRRTLQNSPEHCVL